MCAWYDAGFRLLGCTVSKIFLKCFEPFRNYYCNLKNKKQNMMDSASRHNEYDNYRLADV